MLCKLSTPVGNLQFFNCIFVVGVGIYLIIDKDKEKNDKNEG